VNHKELLERIDRLQEEEEMKKQILVSGFSTFKKQMMPGEIAKRLLRNSIQKVKSFLPHFLSRPKSKVIEIGDSRPKKSWALEIGDSGPKSRAIENEGSRTESGTIENEGSRSKSWTMENESSEPKSGTIENDGPRLKLKATEYGTSRLKSKSIENETHAHEKN